jgi:hypothetical protein
MNVKSRVEKLVAYIRKVDRETMAFVGSPRPLASDEWVVEQILQVFEDLTAAKDKELRQCVAQLEGVGKTPVLDTNTRE